MNNTPRTDEQINGKPCTRFDILAGDSLRNSAVQSEFARGLERELNAANERIKRMEEAGDAMTNCIACGCNDGGCTTCRGYEDKWVKAKEAKL